MPRDAHAPQRVFKGGVLYVDGAAVLREMGRRIVELDRQAVTR